MLGGNEYMEKIMINGTTVPAYNCQQEIMKSVPTDSDLLKIKFDFKVLGKSAQEKVQQVIGGIFDFEIDGYKCRAKSENNTWSYEGNELNEKTDINYHIEVVEIDNEILEEHNALIGMRDEIIYNWSRVRAISELLIEKGIITEDEYTNKVRVVIDRDYDEMFNFIVNGIVKK